MAETKNPKQYDLEERTARFAERCREFIKQLPRTISNTEYSKQLIFNETATTAIYTEANESLSKKDFAHRIRICRKEAKESCLWLRLCEAGNLSLKETGQALTQEASELRKIFTSILNKSL